MLAISNNRTCTRKYQIEQRNTHQCTRLWLISTLLQIYDLRVRSFLLLFCSYECTKCVIGIEHALYELFQLMFKNTISHILALLVLTCACVCGERWSWPELKSEGSLRIDNKLGFSDQNDNRRHPHHDAPAGHTHNQQYKLPYNAHEHYGQYTNYRDQRPNENWLNMYDDLKQCKCIADAGCIIRTDIQHACARGQQLCCYPRTQQADAPATDNTRLIRPKEQTEQTGPASIFKANNQHFTKDILVGPGGPTGIIGPNKQALSGSSESNRRPQSILIGPDGPTGIIGPNRHSQGILVGPNGPTGLIGPQRQSQGVLVGPDGPTGLIGPQRQSQGALVGPDGPTGLIGPQRQSQGVLVGPDGPTGLIGPQRQSQGVLVGPDGPTGLIGPQRQLQGTLVGPNSQAGLIGPQRQSQGILVGPDGPTGIVGPQRQSQEVLVRPGGPTGYIGPQRGRFGDLNEERGILVGPGGPTGIIGPVRGGYGLLNSGSKGTNNYFNPEFAKFPSYRL